MSFNVPSHTLVDQITEHQIAAMARLITRAESESPEARTALAEVYRRAGRANVIGITGVPGSGKSTLVATLTQRLRSMGKRVAIIAVDPSSPFSGGSVLGDRIRMSSLGNDPNVFIRSMATRGSTGGLARATLEVVDILDVGGFEEIIIETVGAGQAEVQIVRATSTTIVLSAPGLGDEIQAIKAGLLEIADIHVVSKADRSDANRTITELKRMLTLSAKSNDSQRWETPVIGVSAYSGAGLDELVGAIGEHRSFSKTKQGEARRASIAEFRVRKAAEDLLHTRLVTLCTKLGPEIAKRLRDRSSDPYSLAQELVNKTLTEQ